MPQDQYLKPVRTCEGKIKYLSLKSKIIVDFLFSKCIMYFGKQKI